METPASTTDTTTDTTLTTEMTRTKTSKSGARSRQRGIVKPPPIGRLLAGLGTSIATGIVLGKLTRDPWSDQVDTFDDRLLKATRKAESKALDPVMGFFSNMGEPQALYSISGLLAAMWLVKHTPAKSLTLGLTLVGSVAIDQAIKSVVKRPRPYLKLPLPRSRPSGSSFPSSHAATSLAAYGAMAMLLTGKSGRKKAQAGSLSAESKQDPQVADTVRNEQSTVSKGRNKGRKSFLRSRLVRVGLPALVCALIGWSRVYRGVHNPSDVLGGWLAGGIWLAACAPRRGSAR